MRFVFGILPKRHAQGRRRESLPGQVDHRVQVTAHPLLDGEFLDFGRMVPGLANQETFHVVLHRPARSHPCRSFGERPARDIHLVSVCKCLQ